MFSSISIACHSATRTLSPVLHHNPGVVGILHDPTDIAPRKVVADGVKDEGADNGAPESLHTDEEEGWGADLHAHDLRRAKPVRDKVL